MDSIQQKDVNGVLNETTMTIHKHEIGEADLHTSCGQSYHLNPEKLRNIRIKQATEELNADRCGNCFKDGRGY